MAPNQNLGDRDQPCENSGVRLRVVARDARSASVAGHVVRSSIIVQPGDRGSASATAATSHEPTIPYGYIPQSSPAYPCARPDKRQNSCDGSELFIVDVWALHQSSPVTARADNEGTSDFDTPHVCGF